MLRGCERRLKTVFSLPKVYKRTCSQPKGDNVVCVSSMGHKYGTSCVWMFLNLAVCLVDSLRSRIM